MANLSKLKQDNFYVLCVMVQDPSTGVSKIQVRKFCWDKVNGPFYTVPEKFYDPQMHPVIIKSLNSKEMKVGGRRNANVKLVVIKKDETRSPTVAANLYLNDQNSFVIQDQVLLEENIFDRSAATVDLNSKETSVLDLYREFKSLDTDDEEDQGITKRMKVCDLPNAFSDRLCGESGIVAIYDAQTLPCLQPSQPEALNSSINCIYGDLDKIVKRFGKFKVFNRFSDQGKLKTVDGKMFISTLERYLTKIYGAPGDITDHFYVLLDKEFFTWYFGLSSQVKSDWSEFKKSFLTSCRDQEFKYYELSALMKPQFLTKLKSIDDKLIEKIEKYPLSTYLKEKSRILSLCYPEMKSKDQILMILSQLSDKAMFAKLFEIRNDYEAVVFYAMSEDEKK